MSLVSDIPRLILEQGSAQAEGLRRRGALVGGTLASIGQEISTIPGQIEAKKIRQQQAEIRNMELQQARMKMAQQQQFQQMQIEANKAIANFPRNEDGTYNAGALVQDLARRNAPLEMQEHYGKLFDSINGVVLSEAKTNQERMANLADRLLAMETPEKPLTADDVHMGIAALKVAGVATAADQRKLVDLMATGQDPRSALRTLGHKQTFKSVPVNSGGILNETTGQVTPTGLATTKPLTNKTELLAAAADPKHPQHQVAIDALKLEEKDPSLSAAQMDARYQALVKKRVLKQPLTPDEQAEITSYERRKTLVPAASFTMQAPVRADARSDRSYTFNSARLDKARTPIADQVTRLDRLVSTINQETPQADALIAPELLTVVAGGMGSGLRLNEAEISRVIGGRSKLESLKAALNKWQLDPTKALSVTPEQRGEIRALIAEVGQRARAKLSTLDSATQALVDADSVEDQRKIVANALKDLETAGAPPEAKAEGKSVTIAQVQAAAAKRGTTYAEAKAFIESQGYTVKAK